MSILRARAVSSALTVVALLAGWAAFAQSPASKTGPVDDPAAIAGVAATKARAAKADHQRGAWDPIHFKPAIDHASNEACLVCHSEITKSTPRDASPAGVKAGDTLAWYQTLDTYSGKQESFHWRHLQSPFGKETMNLQCNFCHQGNDPREKSPHVTATRSDGAPNSSWAGNAPAFTLRKSVNPSETCLRCHGAFPAENMGLSDPWPATREGLETAETPNGCLGCHAEQFRTNRHQTTYLKAANIEKLAKTSSDVCYGCHGGRQWYRTSYSYPRHAWPGMADTPDWAKDRPTQSDPRFQIPKK